MNRIAVAQELVKIAKNLVADEWYHITVEAESPSKESEREIEEIISKSIDEDDYRIRSHIVSGPMIVTVSSTNEEGLLNAVDFLARKGYQVSKVNNGRG